MQNLHYSPLRHNSLQYKCTIIIYECIFLFLFKTSYSINMVENNIVLKIIPKLQPIESVLCAWDEVVRYYSK